MSSKKLITSALPYVNNAPHLGNIIGCVLSADVYARFCRARGYETLYICATDEYGTATENKAREEGVTPREICDKFHALHRDVYKAFNISFDFFGRTSYPEHAEITQSIFKDLERQDMIEEQETEQTYCEHDQMFLADRYVTGKCPLCGFEEARGDQCDNCGKLLQPTEIIDPQCQICRATPVRKSTKHLYLKLPELESQLREFHEGSIRKGNWSNNAVSVTHSWLDNGLLPRPITRDLSWGIDVPRPGYENKVFYVWFDAPIGYISTTKRALPDTWEEWWLDPDNTELYQFMAKDNIPFHTVVFPACLLGTGKPWTLLHHINSTEYLNYEKQKFSKSRGIGVSGTDAVESEIPIDLWRFYLLYNRPEKSDSNFSWDHFLEDVNSNFIDNIGNLLNRVLVFFNKHFDGKITDVEFSSEQKQFLEQVREDEREIVRLLEDVQLKEGLKNVLALGRRGNKFFQDQQPWSTIKTDPSQAKATLTVLIYLVRDLGIMLFPYMPETSERILRMVGIENADFGLLGNWESLERGVLGQPELLYKKLLQKKIEGFKEKFSGSQPKSEDPIAAWKDVLLKVGQIKTVSSHPSADLLYVEEVDCGEEKPRTIVSGLVKYYTPEQLIGKKVLIVANLAPADLRGVSSEGMLLAVEKKKKLEVIEVESAPVGSQVVMENENEHNPPDRIDIDQFLAAKLAVADHTVQIESRRLMIDGDPIKTRELKQGKVR
ncbi:MAG: methionine--tRNA ligase [Proteobacteria bacterium]|nr:methionine--tRNA ligase [Pseudomonadota bacterium]